MIENEIPFLHYVPKIYISAVTHQRLNNIFTKVEDDGEYRIMASFFVLQKLLNLKQKWRMLL